MTEFSATPEAAPHTKKVTFGSKPELRALILSDGKMGDLAPCRGIAAALGAKVEELTVRPGKLAAFLGKRGPDAAFGAMLKSTTLPPPLVLASGRRTVPYLQTLKRKWVGQSLTIFLKDPRVGAGAADLIWVPTHDRLRATNVIDTPTAPHGWTAQRKARAASDLRAQLAKYPRPWLGVLLGGDSKTVTYSHATIGALKQAVQAAAQGAGSIIITPSRRTPEPLKQALQDAHKHVWLWDETGINPYGGILGACDAFLVTGDSHNMVSEVLSAGRHTMVFRPKGIPKKFVGFLNSLEQQWVISPPTKADFQRTQEPIDATPIIAQAIAEALQQRLHWPS